MVFGNQHQGPAAAPPEKADEATLLDDELYRDYGRFINSTYPGFLRRLSVEHAAVKAEGATITDSAGKTYIDCVAGYGMFNLGHNHPLLIEALTNQLKEGTLLSRPFITEPQVELAKRLAAVTPGDLDCAFVCNSGSEAIDSALKLARLHTGRKRLVTAFDSFHGYTYGALSATGIGAFKRGFEPMVPDIVHVPFGDVKALERELDSDTAAVLLEPVQHEAGVVVPDASYLPAVRRLCDEVGALLILDEIKTGMGKTGEMFACSAVDVVPDILVLGKSLSGGVIPIGALVGRRRLWRRFSLSFPMSASSYAGNVLACRSALTAIRILEEGDLLEECEEKGRILLDGLREVAGMYPEVVRDVSGTGLLLGVTAADSQKALDLARQLIERGVLVLPAYGNNSVLMVEPPLVVSGEEVQRVIEAFRICCATMNRQIEESAP